MKLIADSGSTKTDWCLVDADGQVAATCKTQGINPFHQDDQAISAILNEELRPRLDVSAATAIHFYGSGLRPELQERMQRLFRHTFPQCHAVETEGDLLGAARALCGRDRGIACILGTGSNSCLYDGTRIVMNTPPLGYILGDEGSGAVLGARFLNAVLKGHLPAPLRGELLDSLQMSEGDIISRVYRQPLANRWLASLAPFIHAHLHVDAVRQLVIDSFLQFVDRNLVPYGSEDLPVSAVGSIAYHFRAELAEALSRNGRPLGRIERSPLPELVRYHASCP